MAFSEIDSFVLKLKNLTLAGRNATLSIKSESGKTFVTLSVEVDDPPQLLPQQPSGGGPARVRRRARRAAIRAAAAENLNEDPEAEQVKGDHQDVVSEAAIGSTHDTTEDVVTVIQDEEIDDTEMYVLEYFDTSKTIEAQDAVNFMEIEMKDNFDKYNVDPSDQVFKISEIRKSEKGFKLNIKVKKSPVLKFFNMVQNIKLFDGTVHFFLQKING